jgi:mono/diheme cytochrome c family protein
MRRALLLLAPLALAACEPPAPSGAVFYAENCASCHGIRGRGDGPAAAGLSRAPSDLTLIAARNGGVFDRNAVMSAIDGFFRRSDPSHPMPEFGAAFDGPMVMAETGPGRFTPAPATLVALADYLASLQRAAP